MRLFVLRDAKMDIVNMLENAYVLRDGKEIYAILEFVMNAYTENVWNQMSANVILDGTEMDAILLFVQLNVLMEIVPYQMDVIALKDGKVYYAKLHTVNQLVDMEIAQAHSTVHVSQVMVEVGVTLANHSVLQL